MGAAIGCPVCRRFEVRTHPSSSGCGHVSLMCCWCGLVLLTHVPDGHDHDHDDGERPPQAFFDWIDGEIARMEAGGHPPPHFTGTREECIASMREERAERAALPVAGKGLLQ